VAATSLPVGPVIERVIRKASSRPISTAAAARPMISVRVDAASASASADLLGELGLVVDEGIDMS
jgi:hypothetical protein